MVFDEAVVEVRHGQIFIIADDPDLCIVSELEVSVTGVLVSGVLLCIRYRRHGESVS